MVAETGDSEKKEIIMKADYRSGEAGFIKRDFPEVKAYIDESQKRRPAVINLKFEEAVKEMKKSGAPALEPEHKDCDSADFVKRAELRFKMDMEHYKNNLSKITGEMTRGEIVDLTDVTEYNKVAERYGGQI